MSTKKAKKIIEELKIPIQQKPEVHKNKFPISHVEIEEMKASIDRKLVFSFRFLELEHEAFNLGGVCTNWVNDLMRHVQELSDLKRNDFVNRLKEHYRSHEHDWEERPYKFNLDDKFLEQVECRQARISSSKGGIHGFLIGNTFYVVWLDPHHNLYPNDRFGGIKKYSPPQTCCKERDEELDTLRREKVELEKWIESATCPSNVSIQ